MAIHGTKHDDSLDGTSGNDTFSLFKGGDDTAFGGAGNDTFNMGASLNAGDRIDGGADTDKVFLRGDYSAGIVFDADTIKNVEVLRLGEGFDYNLTLNDGNVAAGAMLTVNARALGAGHHLIFDGSAELDGRFTVFDSAGNDTITGGAQADRFNLSKGGNDTVHGGGGNDVFNLGRAFTATDSINGGSGNDTVHLDGDTQSSISVIATATTMTSIETIDFGDGSYALTTADAMVDAGTTLHVNVHGSATILTLNTAAETDGFFAIDSNASENFILFGSAAVLAGSTFTGTGTENALLLNGDFSAGVTLNASQLADFQTLNVFAGHDYNLTTTADAVNASGFEVFGGALGAGNALTFNGSAQTTASFTIFDGSGDDNITTGGGNDDISIDGGTNIVHAGGGDDAISSVLAFTVSDQFDGGTNIVHAGGGTFVFNATTIQNIEELDLSIGSFTITTNDANVASSAVLKVDASTLTAAQVLTFNGGAETDGQFVITGGAGADILTGGLKGDTFTGGGGADTYLYTAAGQSTSVSYDTITDFAAGTDKIDLTFTVQGFAGTENHDVSVATFDQDLLAAGAGDDQLHPFYARIVHASGGDLSGHDFLVVDANGNAQYDAGTDYVIDITGHTGTITTGDFI